MGGGGVPPLSPPPLAVMAPRAIRTHMLKRSRRFERPDYWILAVVGILCLIGVLMVFSSSGVDSDDPTYLINRHVQWLVVGAVALLVAMSTPYARWRRFSVPGILLAVVLVGLGVW